MKSKKYVKILIAIIATTGTIVGVLLSQQQQYSEEKAAFPTCQPCATSTAQNINPNSPSYKCTFSCHLQDNFRCENGCCAKSNGHTYASSLIELKSGARVCSSYSCASANCDDLGGGGGGGGGGDSCSNDSDAKCRGKNPGDSCGSGKKCKKNGTGNDGKPKCSCTAEGGGGGGNSCDKNPNPTVLDITNGGELAISFANFVGSTPPKIALKKNSQTCSLTEYDKIIDTKDITSNQPTKTGIILENGDKLCVYGEDVGNNPGPYPFEGWRKPENNKCGDKDISPITQAAQEGGASVISEQCWGDYAPKADCDFNDYGIVISLYQNTVSTESIKILFRQQGITSPVLSGIPSQLQTFAKLKNQYNSYTIEKIIPSVDDNGVWTLSFSTDDQGKTIPTGTYDLSIKGISHLRKKFSNTVINSGTTILDKSTDIKDELKAGDVNNDNMISIEDISQVLKFYTDFKVKVDSSDKDMVGADVNKDGYITIDDLALVALNWSDFTVEGDE